MLRPTATKVVPTSDYQLIVTFDNGEKRRFDVKPVSYTHLDVYKRQSLGSADELLPDTGMLETARSYRAGKALPVIKKLVRKLREVYALLVNRCV